MVGEPIRRGCTTRAGRKGVHGHGSTRNRSNGLESQPDPTSLRGARGKRDGPLVRFCRGRGPRDLGRLSEPGSPQPGSDPSGTGGRRYRDRGGRGAGQACLQSGKPLPRPFPPCLAQPWTTIRDCNRTDDQPKRLGPAICERGLARSPVLQLRDASLPAECAVARVTGRFRGIQGCGHASQGNILDKNADGIPCSNQLSVSESRRRKSGTNGVWAQLCRRHAELAARFRSRRGCPPDPASRPFSVRNRKDGGHDARQGDLAERRVRTDPVFPHDQNRACHTHAVRSALDQQILHPRSRSRKVHDPVAGGARPHGVSHVLGQSG